MHSFLSRRDYLFKQGLLHYDILEHLVNVHVLFTCVTSIYMTTRNQCIFKWNQYDNDIRIMLSIVEIQIPRKNMF